MFSMLSKMESPGVTNNKTDYHRYRQRGSECRVRNINGRAVLLDSTVPSNWLNYFVSRTQGDHVPGIFRADPEKKSPLAWTNFLKLFGIFTNFTYYLCQKSADFVRNWGSIMSNITFTIYKSSDFRCSPEKIYLEKWSA